jgi:hypothetical protein
MTIVLIAILAVLVYIAYRLTPKKQPLTRGQLLERSFATPGRPESEWRPRLDALLAEAKALGIPPNKTGSWGELEELVVAHRTPEKAVETDAETADQSFPVVIDNQAQTRTRLTLNRLGSHIHSVTNFPTGVQYTEYEYRIDGNAVFVRVINESVHQPPDPQLFRVINGSVPDDDLEARNFDEDTIAGIKERAQWHLLRPEWWNGFSVFILSGLAGPKKSSSDEL